MLDTDKSCALVDQLLQPDLVVGRGGSDGGDIAADGSANHPDQPAHHEECSVQRQRSGQAKVDERRPFDGIGERVDHVPKRERQHERQQQPTGSHQ